MRGRQERGGSLEELIPEFQRTGKNLPGKGVKGGGKIFYVEVTIQVKNYGSLWCLP